MSKQWLWQLFHYFGRVVDVFILWKRKRANPTPFDFVRPARFSKAQAAIKEMDRVEIRGLKLSVSKANYKRRDRNLRTYNEG